MRRQSHGMYAAPKPPKKGCIGYIITPVTFVFFVINFLFFLLGIAALALGGVALFDEDTMGALAKLDDTGALTDLKVEGFMKHLAIALMGTGGLLLIVGFLGCLGVAVGNSCFIYMYCIIFSLLVVGQLVAFGYVYLNKDALMAQLKETLEKNVEKYEGKEDGTESEEGKAMVIIQKFLHCCGVNGGEDYRKSRWYSSPQRQSRQQVPISCCKLEDVNKVTASDPLCQIRGVDKNNPYTTNGCLNQVKNYVFNRGIVAVIVCTSIVVFQLLAICYAAIIEKSFVDDDLTARLAGVVRV